LFNIADLASAAKCSLIRIR